MATVWVVSESRKGAVVYGQVGARRWECEWYELTPAARKRYADPNYEHDHDRDERCVVGIYGSKEDAIAAGKAMAPQSVYGCAIVQEHVLEQDEYHQAAGEWEPVGPQFEVDGNGDVAQI